MAFNSVIEDPKLPTISRWLDLNKRFPKNSTLRMMEYEKLASIELTGNVLDLGGGKNARYKKYLPSTISELISINIDKNIDPTYLIAPGEKFPLEDNSIDACITLNTLEHVYDPKFLIEEIMRVLKPGAKVHITVPWIFRIHGHPDDFSRFTPSWWSQTLQDVGFSNASILPLVWGRYSTAASISGVRGIFKGLQNHTIHLRDIIYATFRFIGTDGKYTGKRGQRVCNVASGHFITATK